jgi:hypothetical protein
MAITYKDMMAAARAVVPAITPAEAASLVEKADALIVDVRDGTEVAASGKAKGAVAVPRGSLESRADPESPNHNPAFRKDRPVILYCAGGGHGLLRRPQPRRLQGLGGRWRSGRTGLTPAPINGRSSTSRNAAASSARLQANAFDRAAA